MKKQPKTEKEQLLEDFINENFPVDELFEVGLFTKEMKGDFQAMADRICKFFGLKTVFDYGAMEVRCHLTYASGLDPAGLDTSRPHHVNERGELKSEPFITEINSIYG